jgi:hypothetical protein
MKRNKFAKIFVALLIVSAALISSFIFLDSILDKMGNKEVLPLSTGANSLEITKGLHGPYVIILDGKEIDSLNVDPANILQVEILKGDTAVDEYGNKAQNDTIVITTKGSPVSP